MHLKVLLVDDDKMAVFLQKIIILESKLTDVVTTFSHGLETLQYLDAVDTPGQAYLIFLDINMPVMNGWELLAHLQSRPYAERVFVVMASSYSPVTDKEASTHYKQIIQVFEKPISLEICAQVMRLPQLHKYFG